MVHLIDKIPNNINNNFIKTVKSFDFIDNKEDTNNDDKKPITHKNISYLARKYMKGRVNRRIDYNRKYDLNSDNDIGINSSSSTRDIDTSLYNHDIDNKLSKFIWDYRYIPVHILKEIIPQLKESNEFVIDYKDWLIGKITDLLVYAGYYEESYKRQIRIKLTNNDRRRLINKGCDLPS